MSQTLDTRMKMERDVVSHLIASMRKNGWNATSVHNGEEEIQCATDEEVMEHVFSVDESSIHFRNPEFLNDSGTPRWHCAFIVLGNDGYDAICDSTYNDTDTFNTVMENEVNPFTDKLAESLG